MAEQFMSDEEINKLLESNEDNVFDGFEETQMYDSGNITKGQYFKFKRPARFDAEVDYESPVIKPEDQKYYKIRDTIFKIKNRG